MKTVKLIISGSVQGIGYRAWVKREATHLGVTGWVKNRNDGTVEMVLSGNDQSIKTLIGRLWKGPMFAHVVDITIRPHTKKETLSSFSVLQ